ncbi:MAG: hypothetical protein WD066_16045 [Planctomycetaceae bacterium]
MLTCILLSVTSATSRANEPHRAPPALHSPSQFPTRQTAPPAGSPYPAASPYVAPRPEPEVGEEMLVPALPAADATCGLNYWIVSTRNCEQHPRGGCPHCEFDYIRYDTDGCLRRADEHAFRQWLDPEAPVCIVVHGSFVDWESVVHDSHHTYRWLRGAAPDRALNVVFYTWPSEGFYTCVPQIDVAILGCRSGFNGHYLAQFACGLPDEHPVSLVGHSHGARTVGAALHLLGGGTIKDRALCGACCPPRRIRAVLAAGAVDHHWFAPGERFGRSLYPIEGLLNLKNEKDIPLCFYHLRKPFGRHAIARSGFTRKDVARMGPLACRVAEMDVTDLVRTGHMWPHYYTRPEIARGLVPWVYFE